MKLFTVGSLCERGKLVLVTDQDQLILKSIIDILIMTNHCKRVIVKLTIKRKKINWFIFSLHYIQLMF